MRFLFYYKLPGNKGVQTHEVFTTNQEAANRKWEEYKKSHKIIDVTKEQEVTNEKGKVHK